MTLVFVSDLMKTPQGKYLILDCETTGLPPRGEERVNERLLPYWPYMVSLAWILFNERRQSIEEKYFVIRPEGFIIPQSATAKHGITTEYALENGSPIKEVLPLLLSAISRSVYLVAHNLVFDEGMIRAECLRNRIEFSYGDKLRLCTMQTTTDYCRIKKPSGNGYKWPKLEELHQKLFRESFAGAHNALTDAKACGRCFFALLDKRVVTNLPYREKFTEFMKFLRWLHQGASEDRDWLRADAILSPEPPTQTFPKKQAAEEKYKAYRPSFLSHQFGFSALKRFFLRLTIWAAERADKAEFSRLKQEYEEKKAVHLRAKRLREGDLNEYRAIIKAFVSYARFEGIDCTIGVDFPNTNEARVSVSFNSVKAFPTSVMAEGSTGKVFLHKVSATERHRAYRHLVFSLSLRLVREVFAHVPVQEIRFTANLSSQLLERESGAPIFKFCVTREQVYSCNLDEIEASRFIESIGFEANFLKTRGFRPLKEAIVKVA